MSRAACLLLLAAVALTGCAFASERAVAPPSSAASPAAELAAVPVRPVVSGQQPLDVIYVPTPDDVVRQMLTLARVKPGDVVYDLGSGDGRIVIAAVKDFGATRGVGIDLDPARTVEAGANARAAGVADRVSFLTQDLFASDFSDASVVAVYLLPGLLQRLVPQLRALAPGTRIVSHNYDMGQAWRPDDTVLLNQSLIHLWRVPR